MATKEAKNINQTFILLAVFFFLLGGIGIFKYALPKLKDARTALAEQVAKNEGIKADINSLNQAKTAVEDAQAYLKNQLGVEPERLRYVFPPTEDVPELYLQMESLILTPGVENPTYQISPPAVDTEGLVRIPISITATGTYGNLKGFLSALQLNIRPVSLLTATFSKAVAKEGEAVTADSLTMTATGFVRAAGLSAAYTTKTPTK